MPGAKKKTFEKEATPKSSFQSIANPEIRNYVTLELNLMNWNFMNFQQRVPTDTHLFTIKQEIEQRHGRIRDLIICKNAFSEKNEMHDDLKTLSDYGIIGAPENDPPVSTHLFYNFKPCDHDDPLLLTS